MSAPVSPDGPPSPDSTRFVVPGQAVPSPYPQHFGSYVLLKRLARGGMGDVCLAKVGRVAGIERLCVVKSIRSTLLGDDEYVRRFIDEARTVVQLAHRNICPVLDVGAVDERYYLAMELIAGRDLRTIQERASHRQGALPQALVLHIVGEVLEALDYAHRQVDPRSGEPLGIVHRDVSPQNVMVSFEGEVKLIDFGLATSAQKSERTEPGVVLGKLQYMSPEQARGDRIDRRTDIFATGVLLYELLVGERYYEGMSIDEVWRLVGGGTHTARRLATLPTELRDIVARAVAGDPAARFQSCAELSSALHEYQVRRQRIGSPTELRALMTTLFPGEEAEDRRARAALAAAPAPAPPRELTRSVRFAALAAAADTDVTAPNEKLAPLATEHEPEPPPGEPFAPVEAPSPGPPPKRAPTLGRTMALVAITVIGVALVAVWFKAGSGGSGSPPPPVTPLAVPSPRVAVEDAPPSSTSTVAVPVGGVPAQPPAPLIDEPAAAVASVSADSPDLGDIEPLASPAGRPDKRVRKRTPTPAVPHPAPALPEVPSTTTGRVKFLGEHCRALSCTPPLLAIGERWRLMPDQAAREHVEAVKECAQRCSERGGR